jgi:chromosome partitioning protein
MSIMPACRAHAAPHVVVVGNHKGGSGKSTVAMHIIVALLKAGKRVASFDLDLTQRTLTHYIDNRREWAKQNELALELPHHCPVVEDHDDGTERDDAADLRRFASHLAALERDHGHDFIVIDTPGGVQHLSLIAHGMADTLVTPINDSLVDLDVIVAVRPGKDGEPQASRYAKTVARALRGRKSICSRATDWIVVRNRLAALASRNQRQVADLLESVGTKIGFRTARGLSERLVFREFFSTGLTALDPIARPARGIKPSASHLVARLEIRDLVEQIGLLASAPNRTERASAGEDGDQSADAEDRIDAQLEPVAA